MSVNEEKNQPQSSEQKIDAENSAKLKSEAPLSEKDEVKEAERNTNKLNTGK